MTRRRPIERRDANHNELSAALSGIGVKVISTASVGKGFPDAVLIYKGKIHLVEFKDGSKPPSARALTPDQVTFHADCAVHGYIVPVVTNLAEALALYGARLAA